MSCGRSRNLPANARSLHGLEWGQAGGPPFLLLHSLAAHSHWWDWVAPRWADRRYLLAVDFRGHGRSQWADPPTYTFDDYVGDLLSVLDGLAIERAVVVGHSMGAYVGARLAATHPDRVQALVIADTLTSWTPEQAARAERQASRQAPVFSSSTEASSRFRLQPPETTAPEARVRHLGETAVVEPSPGRWTFAFDPKVFLHPPVDPWPFLPKISCPSLVIRGELSSIMSREAAQRVAQAIAGGCFAELPRAFHHLILDDPDGFVRAVDDFLTA